MKVMCSYIPVTKIREIMHAYHDDKINKFKIQSEHKSDATDMTITVCTIQIS